MAASVVTKGVLGAIEPAAHEVGLVAGDAKRRRLPSFLAGRWRRCCVLCFQMMPKITQMLLLSLCNKEHQSR